MTAAECPTRSPCDTRQSRRAPARPVVFSIVPSPYFRWNGIVGRLVAALLLVPGLPVILLLVAVTRLTSRGPGLYRQVRVGLHGKPFTMLKIRTMVHDAEKLTGPVWATQDDRRVTRLGRLLRSLHLDELPQLINVLKGEMALMGPRPERPEIALQLAEQIPNYYDRLSVLPGISGLAQINLPPDSTLDDVRRKLILDLEYVRCGGAILDTRMFIYSCLRMMLVPEQPMVRVMRLHRRVTIAEALTGPDPATAMRIAREMSQDTNGKHHENHNGHGNGNGAAHEHSKPDTYNAQALPVRSKLDVSGS